MATLAATLPFVLGGDPPLVVVPPTLVPPVPFGVDLSEASATDTSALPRDLMLDSYGTGDLALPNGDLVHTTGAESIAQSLDLAFSYFKGEWFADLDQGFDLFGLVLVENPNEDLIREECHRVALTVPGVISVSGLSFDIDLPSRSAEIDITVQSDFGEVRRLIQVTAPTEIQ